MEQKTNRLYPTAPLAEKNNGLEKRLETKSNDVNSFSNSITNNKQMITCFRVKNNK